MHGWRNSPESLALGRGGLQSSLCAKRMGRGTMRSMVEGQSDSISPSPALRAVPLPMELRSTGRTREPNMGGGGLLLPGAPRAAGVRFCCPVRPDRAFDFVTLAVRLGVTRQSRVLRYRWHLCNGPSRWSHSGRKLRVSTHVDPGSAPPTVEPHKVDTHAGIPSKYYFDGIPLRAAPADSALGGAAGYCPRVRCIY
ncbi:MAG: hypothetical protein QOH86_1770 [Sphingomonadales bacterium]|nr:hypothetical protein [Sphingomonadales bacterium]